MNNANPQLYTDFVYDINITPTWATSIIYTAMVVALIFGVLFLVLWMASGSHKRRAYKPELRSGMICLALALICYCIIAWGIVPERYAVWIADKDNAIVIDAPTYRAYTATGISSIRLTRTEAQNLNADRVRLGAEERRATNVE